MGDEALAAEAVEEQSAGVGGGAAGDFRGDRLGEGGLEGLGVGGHAAGQQGDGRAEVGAQEQARDVGAVEQGGDLAEVGGDGLAGGDELPAVEPGHPQLHEGEALAERADAGHHHAGVEGAGVEVIDEQPALVEAAQRGGERGPRSGPPRRARRRGDPRRRRGCRRAGWDR